jgi:hypothetical protein
MTERTRMYFCSLAAAWPAAAMGLLALHHYCDVKEIRIEADSGEPANARHVARLKYRLSRFRELFPIELGGGLSDTPLDEFRGRLFLNQPLSTKSYLPTYEPDRRAGTELDLELKLLGSPSLRRAFSRAGHEGMRVMRRWPVGVFHDKVARKNHVFTGGSSAIDLIAVDGDTLLLFELKKKGNAKVGALSEAFFYACVMRDALREIFRFEETPILPGLALSREHVKRCTRIRIVLLAPRFHVLIHSECCSAPSMLTSLNKAARREWAVVPVEFEAWTFRPLDFEFTEACGSSQQEARST